MRKEQYFINETFTVEFLVEQAGIDPRASSLMASIVIVWMYLILAADNHVDVILRLFRSNRFVI